MFGVTKEASYALVTSTTLNCIPNVSQYGLNLYSAAVLAGKKSYGGFKSDHQLIAKKSNEEFGVSYFTVKRCKSKLSQTFKKEYNAFVACKNASGFVWDKVRCEVTALNEVWDNFLLVRCFFLTVLSYHTTASGDNPCLQKTRSNHWSAFRNAIQDLIAVFSPPCGSQHQIKMCLTQQSICFKIQWLLHCLCRNWLWVSVYWKTHQRPKYSCVLTQITGPNGSCNMKKKKKKLSK
ncbi:hypothetical protein VP01_40g12 [Puccinia sorghi]|uniref:Myb/SANT-like domain-containing protein n=1 Tax=Puccinia sorghi TaxID=27349 RepID=A0A0L6URB1_9BASI|nr:hypothetical protein VP01_40g12 [Puccinia sorghi]